MKATFATFTAILALATARPAAKRQSVVWSVSDLQIESSTSTGQASISFKTNAGNPGQRNTMACGTSVTAPEDGSLPRWTKNACNTTGLTYSFNPPFDGNPDAASLIIYTPNQMGVAMIDDRWLVSDEDGEKYTGSRTLGISNIFDN